MTCTAHLAVRAHSRHSMASTRAASYRIRSAAGASKSRCSARICGAEGLREGNLCEVLHGIPSASHVLRQTGHGQRWYMATTFRSSRHSMHVVVLLQRQLAHVRGNLLHTRFHLRACHFHVPLGAALQPCQLTLACASAAFFEHPHSKSKLASTSRIWSSDSLRPDCVVALRPMVINTQGVGVT